MFALLCLSLGAHVPAAEPLRYYPELLREPMISLVLDRQAGLLENLLVARSITPYRVFPELGDDLLAA